MSIIKTPESHNNLAETQVKQSRPEEASAQPEQAELKIRVIKLKSVLTSEDSDEISIEYTWVQGGNPDASYTLPLSKVREMVERGGVCIFSEGFDDSQVSNVEENLAKLREFVEDQENLRRKREREEGLDLLADTASELSFPDSTNSTEVAGVPDVSTGPETGTVATQTDSSEQKPNSGGIESQQTDSSEQEPGSDGIESRINTGDQSSEAFTSPETDTVAAQAPEQKPNSGGIESQQTDSSEQEPDSDGIESRINDILKNENCYARLKLMQDFLTSGEFEISSVSPEYIQLIANAILTIVDQGIQSQGLQFVNYFLTEYYAYACFDILDKAIGMGSTQTAEQLKERLTELFTRIRDQVVQFDYLVRNIWDTSSPYSTPSEIIGQDNLSFLKLIYQKITERGSLVNEIIKEVFAEPFNQWVEANIARIKQIPKSVLQKVDEGKIAQDLERLEELKASYDRSSSGLSEGKWSEYDSIKAKYKDLRGDLSNIESILTNYNQDLSWNGPDIYKVSTEYKTEYNNILTSIESLLSKLDQIIDFRIQ